MQGGQRRDLIVWGPKGGIVHLHVGSEYSSEGGEVFGVDDESVEGDFGLDFEAVVNGDDVWGEGGVGIGVISEGGEDGKE